MALKVQAAGLGTDPEDNRDKQPAIAEVPDVLKLDAPLGPGLTHLPPPASDSLMTVEGRPASLKRALESWSVLAVGVPGRHESVPIVRIECLVNPSDGVHPFLRHRPLSISLWASIS